MRRVLLLIDTSKSVSNTYSTSTWSIIKSRQTWPLYGRKKNVVTKIKMTLQMIIYSI